MDDERRLSQDRIKFLHPRFPQRGKGGIEKAEEFEKKFFITLTLTLGVPMTYTSDEVMLATLFPMPRVEVSTRKTFTSCLPSMVATE